jgi:hypothetical protein
VSNIRECDSTYFPFFLAPIFLILSKGDITKFDLFATSLVYKYLPHYYLYFICISRISSSLSTRNCSSQIIITIAFVQKYLHQIHIFTVFLFSSLSWSSFCQLLRSRCCHNRKVLLKEEVLVSNRSGKINNFMGFSLQEKLLLSSFFHLLQAKQLSHLTIGR